MSFEIWGIDCNYDLSDKEKEYLMEIPDKIPSIEWVWAEIDQIWDSLNLNNKISLLKQDKIGEFYGHPAWIMNGLFTEADEISIQHRKNIADFIIINNISNIADYGGGSGILAKNILKRSKFITIDIIDPYFSNFVKSKSPKYSKVNYLSEFRKITYDLIIAQDVLEHVENPIELAYEISSNVKDDGLVIFANCFYPVIKCHLPATFYLRYTFKFLMKKMGLSYIGVIPGAKHALIFQVIPKSLNLQKVCFWSKLIKPFGNLLNNLYSTTSIIKQK